MNAIASSVLNSVLGSTAKAALLIYRPTKEFYTCMEQLRKIGITTVDDPLEKTTVKAARAAFMASMHTINSGIMMAGGIAASSLYDAVMGSNKVAKEVVTSLMNSEMMKGFKYYEFQYNPETIDMTSQQGSFMSRQGAPESGLNQLSMTNIDAETRMHFKVIFDQVNNHDAFMANKLNLTSGADILSTITMLCNTYSVQGDVDGLLAITTQTVTRRVVFCFGTMFFAGELENVQARYTMFSPSGRPIAAEVEFSIRQSRNTKYKNIFGLDDNIFDNMYWDRAAEDFFGKAGEDSKIDLRPFGLNNLLNVNL